MTAHEGVDAATLASSYDDIGVDTGMRDVMRSTGNRVDDRVRHREQLALAAACVAGYLYGSLPVVYALGRLDHADLRATGSGNVGATNLLAVGDPAWSAGGWLFDASKGVVPVLAARAVGLSRERATLAGVCGTAGQCWPVFLRFRGGRGISAFIGASLMMTDATGWAWTLVPFISGGLWRVVPRLSSVLRRSSALPVAQHRRGARSMSVPLGCFLGVCLFPAICAWRAGGVKQTLVAPSLLSGLIMLRRATATLPDDREAGPAVRREALLYRLLFDRNTRQ